MGPDRPPLPRFHISIAGCRGTIAMGVLGVLLIGVINNGLNLLNFDAAYQSITTGGILVAAVAIDAALQVFWRGRTHTGSSGPSGSTAPAAARTDLATSEATTPHVLGAQPRA